MRERDFFIAKPFGRSFGARVFNGLFDGSDEHIVIVDFALGGGDEGFAEEAGAALGIGGGIFEFEGPGVGFFFGAGPGLGLDEGFAGGLDDLEFHTVPSIGFPLKTDGFGESTGGARFGGGGTGPDLDDGALVIALEGEDVAGVDDASVGDLAGFAEHFFADLDVGGDGVVVHVGVAEVGTGGVVEIDLTGFDEGFVGVFTGDLFDGELATGADPGERGFVEGGFFEIEGPGESGEDADAGGAGDAAVGGLHGAALNGGAFGGEGNGGGGGAGLGKGDFSGEVAGGGGWGGGRRAGRGRHGERCGGPVAVDWAEGATFFIEGEGFEGDGFAGMEDDIGGDDLNPGGLDRLEIGKGFFFDGLRDEIWRDGLGVFVADAIHLVGGLKIDAAIADGDGAEDDVFAAEFFGEFDIGEDGGFFIARLKDDEAAVGFGDEEFAIGVDEGGFADGADVFAPEDFAGAEMEGEDGAFVVDDVEFSVGEGGGGEAGFEAVAAPDFFGLSGGGVDATDAAEDCVVEVFFGMADVDAGALDDDAGIEAAFAGLPRPYLFAGADLEGMYAAIAGGEDGEALAVDDGDDGGVVRGVDGSTAGGGGPVEFAGVFVEGEEAVLALGVIAPAEGDAAHEELVFVEGGGGGSSAEGGDDAEFFGGLA